MGIRWYLRQCNSSFS